VALSPARLRQHIPARQQGELDADPGESDALPPRLCARRKIVIAAQVPARHPLAVIGDRDGGAPGLRRDPDQARAGVERVRDDLRQYGLLQRPGVGVPQVFEEVQQVNARLGHGT
jgi:hypothetical protein